MTRISIVGSERMLLSSLITRRKVLRMWSRSVILRASASFGARCALTADMSRLLLAKEHEGQDKVRRSNSHDRNYASPKLRHSQRLGEYPNGDGLIPGRRECQADNLCSAG